MLKPILAFLAAWGMAGFGAVGVAVAIPIAVTHVHTPVIPVLACGLTGAGLLLGVWVTRGRRRRS